MTTSVIIYTTDWCPYCVRAKLLLKQKRVAFTEVNIEERADLRSWLKSASGQHTVPQVFINGQAVGGFTDLADLDRKGQLDSLLAAPPAPDLAPLPT